MINEARIHELIGTLRKRRSKGAQDTKECLKELLDLRRANNTPQPGYGFGEEKQTDVFAPTFPSEKP